mgnify:CR=1 FL=1
MPKFHKTEDQLETMFDKWMFVLRNLSRLMERPAALQERIFEKLFRAAEIARFSKSEIYEYEDSLKVFRDMYSMVWTAINNGRKEGLEEGIKEGIEKGMEKGKEEEKRAIARNMKSLGLSDDIIAQATGLASEEIGKL